MKRIHYFLPLLLIIILVGCTKKETDIKNYLNAKSHLVEDSKFVLPDLADLPKYEDITYLYTEKPTFFGVSDRVVLVIKYDQETYLKEKQRLSRAYVFYTHTVDDPHRFDSVIEDQFSINSYTFRIVSLNKNNITGLPKILGSIGTSDEINSIAYLFFQDTELDAIRFKEKLNVMPELVKELFEYDFE